MGISRACSSSARSCRPRTYRIASHRIVSSCLSYAILAPYHAAHTHKTPRAMLLSLLALCAAPTPPQSAFTPPATQQALPATQPALSASLAAAEAQDGDQTIADTDTDTDRVPSHTSGRDRRDDQHCLARMRENSRTFPRCAYDKGPARCWQPSRRLERARRAPDQGRRAPVAH